MLKKVYWNGCPYELRRFLFKVRSPHAYEMLQSLRMEESARANGASLKPFLDSRSIYVHIPKTAGVSINTSLYDGPTGIHKSAAMFQKAFSKQEYSDFFKFAFVRNPWDRLVSAYLFMKKGGKHDSDKQWAQEHLAPYSTFEDFVIRWLNKENIQLGIHFKSQKSFICLPTKSDHEMDFIGYFETLQADYNFVRKQLSTGETLSSRNRNNDRKDYRTYYTPETQAIVSEVYKEDIELLGYDFDNTSILKRTNSTSGNLIDAHSKSASVRNTQ